MSEAMLPDEQMAEVERLKSLMMKKTYFVMHRRIAAPERLRGALLDHYRWIIALEKQGYVFASGPVFTRDDSQGVGMTIFRANDWDHAEAMAASDPFCICGAALFEIQRWQINEGRMTIGVDLSDGRLHLE